MAVVLLPQSLVVLFPGAARRVDVDASTVTATLDALDRRWPGMRDRLADARPSIRQHIVIFVDGERAGLDTAVRAGSEILVMPALSGG